VSVLKTGKRLGDLDWPWRCLGAEVLPANERKNPGKERGRRGHISIGRQSLGGSESTTTVGEMADRRRGILRRVQEGT